MVFSSIAFICAFLPVTLALYWLLPGIRAKNVLLVVASLAFYAYGEPRLVVLLIASTLVNYVLGLLVGARAGAAGDGADDASAGQRRGSRGSRAWLVVAVVANLAFLGVFKYASMVVGTVNGLLGLSVADPHLPLPLGISFYTFQALSYVIDVYGGEVAAQRNYLRLLLFISLFPQLVAGPIVKYHDIEEQIAGRVLTLSQTALGMRRFVCGLAKKVLVANAMAGVADTLWTVGPAGLDARGAWLAAFAYLMQIYFDFSGYSDMAIGLGALFGFTFRENFEHPYVSTSIREFWRRWHISLSTWFKEYLYIPLGGNRKGPVRAGANKIVVFLLCGLWHGANWTFVVWGVIHGAFQLLEEVTPLRRLPRALGHLYTLLVVCVSFVIFRADTLADGWAMISCMLCGWKFAEQSTIVLASRLTPLFVVTALAACVGSTSWPRRVLARIEGAEDGVRVAVGEASLGEVNVAGEAACLVATLAVFVLCVAVLASGTYNPFIYFRF